MGRDELTSINSERRLRRLISGPPGSDSRLTIIARFAQRIRQLYLDDKNTLTATASSITMARRRGCLHSRPLSIRGDASDPMEGYAGVTYDLLQAGSNGIQTPVRLVTARR
jgi:hypothetical protein